MRLVTLKNAGRPTVGVVVGDNIINLAASAECVPRATAIPCSMRKILESGESCLSLIRTVIDIIQSNKNGLREQLLSIQAIIPFDEKQLLAPIPNPNVVLSCGMNYRKHLEEMGGGMPTTPTAFLKSTSAIIGPKANIVLPSLYPDMVDWEAEFCGVIGKTCHKVSADEALDYVMGYTMINDVSARNWVKPMGELKGLEATKAWDLNLLGKQFPTFCPMGPAIVTKDEISDPNNVKFKLTLNGTVKQLACTDDHIFCLADLIAYYSQWYVFQPGDVISTGSPSGVGMGEKPFVFLHPGDEVILSADGVGSMSNIVVAE
jgi:2-keto-4-pentenoate hydratase/2-oxohepta-3-ene-1,7-dioic acid hydratase in catechol pathway